jgi:CBS domain-containing protein
MLVREIMSKEVRFIKPDDNITTAAKRMRDYDVGAFPVTKGDEILDMITDRDIVIEAIAKGKDPDKTMISEIIKKGNVHVCNENDEVDKAATIMKDAQIRRLIVKNSDNKISGMLSLGDIAANADMKLVGETTRQISQPVY